jgi:hypothetical protein
VQSFAITFRFVVQEELKEQAQMKLPNAQSLKRKVVEIRNTTIKVDFEFVD